MQKKGEVRRNRLRLLRAADAPGGPFDPPVWSVSPRHLRHVGEGGRAVVSLDAAREELWVRGDGERVRAVIDEAGKLALRVPRDGSRDVEVEHRFVYIPTGRRPDEGVARYFGRWEYGRDSVVLSERGAGVILRPDSLTLERPPELVHVYEGEGLLLALRDVPNGARVVAAEGVEGLAAGDLLSDVKTPDVERGPDVAIGPIEAFLRGFLPVGFEASFAGLDFAGFAPAQGDNSPHLARLLKRRDGIAWAALRPVEPVDDVDGELTVALAKALAPSPVTGRVRLGKPGTITLTDGRRYRVRAGVREHLPSGALELVVCALLDGVLRLELGVPFDEVIAPDANAVLARCKGFLLALRARPLDDG